MVTVTDAHGTKRRGTKKLGYTKCLEATRARS